MGADRAPATATKATHTLLGEWLEEVRAGREQTIDEVSEATGLGKRTLDYLRHEVTAWLHNTTRERIAGYLDVRPETVDLLLEHELEGPLQTHDRRARQDRVELSMLAHRIDVVRNRRGHRLGDAADAMDMHPGVLSRIRQIGVRMHLATRERIAGYIDADVDQIARWAQQPAPRIVALPIETLTGTKYHPTVEVNYGSCRTCPFREPCRRDVIERQGFAWCEALTERDLRPRD